MAAEDLRRVFVTAAEKLEEDARKQAVAHFYSAESETIWGRRLDYLSAILGAFGTAGAGHLIFDCFTNSSSWLPLGTIALIVATGSNSLLAVINYLNKGEHSPQKKAENLQEVAIELQELRHNVEHWKKFDVPNDKIPLQDLTNKKGEFDEIYFNLLKKSVKCKRENLVKAEEGIIESKYRYEQAKNDT